MAELEDAKETLSDLNEAFQDQKERAKEEDVVMPDITAINEMLRVLNDAINADPFDEDAFDELEQKAEELIEAFEEEIDDLCQDDEMDAKTQARLEALQNSVETSMAGSLEALLAKADPVLIASFEGVDVPGWAMAAAAITSAGQNEKAQAEALARINLDMGKYMRIQDHFTARMQGDTTFQLSMIYGKAFGEAQIKLAEQHDSNPSRSTSTEIVSIEKFAEVGAAMSAWSEGGEDVNAMLQSEFGYTAASWAKEQMVWTKKLKAEPALFEKVNELEVKFKAKYESVDQDDDLDF